MTLFRCTACLVAYIAIARTVAANDRRPLSKPAGEEQQEAKAINELLRQCECNGMFRFIWDGGVIQTEHVRENGEQSLRVVHVDFGNFSVNDSMLKIVKRFSFLKSLVCSGPISDKGLKRIRKLKNLTRLKIGSGKITDDGTRYLAKLSRLRKLDLAATLITDDGLMHLKRLTALRILKLPQTITDNGLRVLGNMRRLEQLTVHGNSNVTDAGLRHVEGLSNLVFLDITSTRVSDKGLTRLYGLKKLKWIILFDVHRVSEGAVKRLKNALPNCKITH